MPSWVQWLIGAAAVVTAAGVLWTKAVRPMARLIAAADEMLPLLRDLTRYLKDSPDAFKILGEIVAEFRTDSGSSLRDVVNRLDRASMENRIAAEVLAEKVEAVKILAREDRAGAARIMAILEAMAAKNDLATETAPPVNSGDDP
jgi:methyl-accepting chemotaxis protein